MFTKLYSIHKLKYLERSGFCFSTLSNTDNYVTHWFYLLIEVFNLTFSLVSYYGKNTIRNENDSKPMTDYT